jgi:hypothetical protein
MPTRDWPHLDDTEYDRRVAALTTAANDGDRYAATALGYLARTQGDQETAMTWWRKAAGPNLDPESDPSTPAATLELLADHEVGKVRGGVAVNPSTPVATLEKLAEDEEVREAVAENPSTPVATLGLLAEDEHAGVRWGVARNPSTPVAPLGLLANNADPRVRFGVAGNVAASMQVFEDLSRADEDFVRARLIDNPCCPPAILISEESQILRADLARRSDLSAAQFETLIEASLRSDVDIYCYGDGTQAAIILNSHAPQAIKDKCLELGLHTSSEHPKPGDSGVFRLLVLLLLAKLSNQGVIRISTKHFNNQPWHDLAIQVVATGNFLHTYDAEYTNTEDNYVESLLTAVTVVDFMFGFRRNTFFYVDKERIMDEIGREYILQLTNPRTQEFPLEITSNPCERTIYRILAQDFAAGVEVNLAGLKHLCEAQGQTGYFELDCGEVVWFKDRDYAALIDSLLSNSTVVNALQKTWRLLDAAQQGFLTDLLRLDTSGAQINETLGLDLKIETLGQSPTGRSEVSWPSEQAIRDAYQLFAGEDPCTDLDELVLWIDQAIEVDEKYTKTFQATHPDITEEFLRFLKKTIDYQDVDFPSGDMKEPERIKAARSWIVSFVISNNLWVSLLRGYFGTGDLDLDQYVLAFAKKNALDFYHWLTPHFPVSPEWHSSLKAEVERKSLESWRMALPKTLIGPLAQALVTDGNEVLRRYYSNPAESLLAWSQNTLIASSPGDTIAIATFIAANSLTPITGLQHLTRHEEPAVRLAAASALAVNPLTPAADLANLAVDEDTKVREGVAANPSTPVATLEKLAKGEDEWVRLKVAWNPATPVATLTFLARDQSASVRKAVYQNPNATDEIRAQAVLLGIEEDE